MLLYHLLSGAWPFWPGDTSLHGLSALELREGIVARDPAFPADPWAALSPAARDLVSRLLEKDPRRRLTAAAAAEHPWFAEALGAPAAAAAASEEQLAAARVAV